MAGATKADVKPSPTDSLTPKSFSEGVFVRIIHNLQSILVQSHGCVLLSLLLLNSISDSEWVISNTGGW